MASDLNPVVVVPARLASTRLPDKPLADIGGRPMIVHVMERAAAADVGPVLVACAEEEIAVAVRKAGGVAVLTDPDLPSGSDRVAAALREFDPAGRYDAVVNVQGDLPTIDPRSIRAAVALLSDEAVDIGTIAAMIRDEEEATNPNVVKAVFARHGGEGEAGTGRALYFSRATVPTGEGPLYHHIGLYVYRRDSLARFVALPPGVLEQRERLEQLRALEHGMRIDVAVVDTVPLGVDTPADLAKARQILASA